MLRRLLVASVFVLILSAALFSLPPILPPIEAQWIGGRATRVTTSFCTNFWKMENESASIGGMTFSNLGGVAFASGKIGNAGTFVRASNRCLRGNPIAMGPSGAVAFWFKTDTANSDYQYLVDYYGINSGSFLVVLNYPGRVGRIRFCTASPAAGFAETTDATYNDGNWHLIVAYHNSGTGINTLIVDNGTPTTAGDTMNPANVSDYLYIGEYGGGGGYYAQGQIDEVCLAKNAVPSADQIAAFWGGGSGAEPPLY